MPIDANADSRDLNDCGLGASQSSAVPAVARAGAVLERAGGSCSADALDVRSGLARCSQDFAGSPSIILATETPWRLATSVASAATASVLSHCVHPQARCRSYVPSRRATCHWTTQTWHHTTTRTGDVSPHEQASPPQASRIAKSLSLFIKPPTRHAHTIHGPGCLGAVCGRRMCRSGG